MSAHGVQAKNDWCSKKSPHYIIHWMNKTTTSRTGKEAVLTALKFHFRNIYKDFGSRITLIQHTKTSIRSKYSSCIPGCAEKGAFGKLAEQMGGYGCSSTLADKRLKKEIKPKLNYLVRQMINAAPEENVGTFNELIRAANYHEKQQYKQKVEIIFLASMNPLTSSRDMHKDHDTAFVKTVLSTKSAPKSLSKLSVTCIGGNMKNATFWRDIFEAYSVEPSLDCN